MYCEKCNTFLPPGQNVCVKCGHVNTKESQNTVVSHQNQDFQSPQNAYLKREDTPLEDSNPFIYTSKETTVNDIAIIVLAIIFIFVPIVVYGFLLFQFSFSVKFFLIFLPWFVPVFLGLLSYNQRESSMAISFVCFFVAAILVEVLLFSITGKLSIAVVIITFFLLFLYYIFTENKAHWMHDKTGRSSNSILDRLSYISIFCFQSICQPIYLFLLAFFIISVLLGLFSS